VTCPDLDRTIFLSNVPQFSNLTPAGLAVLDEQIDYVNKKIRCSQFGFHTNRARSFLAAHYLSILLEFIQASEENPGGGGGTNITNNRIAEERVGEVQIKFHKPRSAGTSNEHNDPFMEDYQLTDYGKMYLAILRTIGLRVATTNRMYLK